ncbi:hypothetical protein [Nocardia callitridis]|uniref:Uncharacterized protein n=1 Tax=Nocardia callitridis TaxID=648753 RepID=A0ABP9K061_9NOCA
MDSILGQVFSIVLVLGALVVMIPLARQVFRRSRQDDESDESKEFRGPESGRDDEGKDR